MEEYMEEDLCYIEIETDLINPQEHQKIIDAE